MPDDARPGSRVTVVLQSVQPLTTDVRALGDDVVVLTDGPVERVVRADAPAPPHVESHPREEWAAVLRRLAPSSVVTNDEFCLLGLAALRDELGLPRVTPSALEGYLDKVVMKTALTPAGVPVPRWAALERVRAGDALPPGLDPPVVVKPRVGANSRGVRVLHDLAAWTTWTGDHAGEEGWQVEERLTAPTGFVDGLVVDGDYEPVLAGRYLGPLLPEPGVDVLGAVGVPRTDPLWPRAVALGRRVAEVLGGDGRFATHLEFFDAADGLVVLEVCARAPGALVSEMARVGAGVNLEVAHLALQAGRPRPPVRDTGRQAAWLSVLARPGAVRLADPRVDVDLETHALPRAAGAGGRTVALLALLGDGDPARLDAAVRQCSTHPWFGEPPDHG